MIRRLFILLPMSLMTGPMLYFGAVEYRSLWQNLAALDYLSTTGKIIQLSTVPPRHGEDPAFLGLNLLYRYEVAGKEYENSRLRYSAEADISRVHLLCRRV
jgi:hypothetical protein